MISPTPNSLPSTSERCHTAANKLRDFDTQDLEASTHLLVWLGEILNEAEATLRLASFELARSVPSERGDMRDAVLAEAIDACKKEHLHDSTGTAEDAAYDRAVTDCVSAILALMKEPK